MAFSETSYLRGRLARNIDPLGLTGRGCHLHLILQISLRMVSLPISLIWRPCAFGALGIFKQKTGAPSRTATADHVTGDSLRNKGSQHCSAQSFGSHRKTYGSVGPLKARRKGAAADAAKSLRKLSENFTPVIVSLLAHETERSVTRGCWSQSCSDCCSSLLCLVKPSAHMRSVGANGFELTRNHLLNGLLDLWTNSKLQIRA